VESLKQKYHFLDLYQHHCDEECSIDGAYIVNLDYSDLTHPDTIENGDDLEAMIKKRHQVELPVGQKRIAEYQQAWSDVLEIARKYLECSQAQAPSK